MQSRDLSAGIKKSGIHILVEGPAWGDADFYGHWLLEAVKAQISLVIGPYGAEPET
jgi:hypothetical protein